MVESDFWFMGGQVCTLNFFLVQALYVELNVLTKEFKKYQVIFPWECGGGGGYSTNVYTGRLRPEVQPPTLLYTIFHEKGTPFIYLLLHPSVTDPMESVSPVGSQRKSHWAGLFSTGFFILVVYFP